MRAAANVASALAVAACVTACGSFAGINPPQSAASRDRILGQYHAWRYDLTRARFEFGCRDGEVQDELNFNAEYGYRIRAIEAWFERGFTEQELASRLDDTIFVGGCRRDRKGNPVMEDEIRFQSSLVELERSIRKVEVN